MLASALLLLSFTVVTADDSAPEQAICRVCELRGSAHGAEEVAASREYEGTSYHFCSEECAKAFDGFPSGYAAHPVPRPAPALSVRTTDGEEIALGESGGDFILLDFWATWCAPCIKAMPEIEALQREYGEQGLRALGISIDEQREEFEKFLRRNELEYAVAIDGGERPAWYQFAVATIPAMFLIDAKGQIVAEWKGAFEMKEVREEVEAFLGEKTEGR